MVSVLAIGQMVRGFKPGRAIKIRSTSSFGREEKPENSYHKILRHIKIKLTYKQKYFAKLNSHSFRPLLLLATRCLCWKIARELWKTSQEFSSVIIIISSWFSILMYHLGDGPLDPLVTEVQRRSLTPKKWSSLLSSDNECKQNLRNYWKRAIQQLIKQRDSDT
jgi:hypothetical protein